ncbi:hypothetical protein HYH02_002119 [Chlamydomonas schloesseri]|uniref:lipoyl(octanoyl) transferase n=1 Tax=Chlamydomonas schloesseri TaxID=2026947 RepID=A0A835WWH7_9CHLO|nr:hypothetical protein HYH02_002119 [Chlamydomonas schloesseri]|eukprot:KAG2453916.1 hypothetical protein HYH02_002119 [Chlamydomonas schloesseri]
MLGQPGSSRSGATATGSHGLGASAACPHGLSSRRCAARLAHLGGNAAGSGKGAGAWQAASAASAAATATASSRNSAQRCDCCCNRGRHGLMLAATAAVATAARSATCQAAPWHQRRRVSCAAADSAQSGGAPNEAAHDIGGGGGGGGRVVVYDLSDQVVDYEKAWAWQRALLARATAAADAGQPRGSCNAAILLQHPPVYTLGTGSTLDHLHFPPGAPPIPLYRTERGGEVTYHGPGQLVLYPILDLQAPPLRPDLHWYLRQLEQVVIEALDGVSGLAGGREEGLTGVWVGGAKVAAIGVKAKRWVTFHGVALNVVADLAPFRTGLIVPCGIADRPVTSVAELMAAAAAAEDPFAGVAAGPGPGSGPVAGGEMIPLSEASQEDLRRMLAATGMSPLVITESPPPGAGSGACSSSSSSSRGGGGGGGDAGTAAAAAAAAWDVDDPFAPAADDPFAALASGPGPAGGGTAAQASGAADAAPGAPQAAQPSDTSSGGSSAGRGWSVRSEWNEAERLLLREYSCALLAALEDVFGLQAVAGDVAELEGLAAAAALQQEEEAAADGRGRPVGAAAER